MAFWDTVDLLREEQNTSYRWISQKTGLSETTISSMRHAGTEPRASDAVKLAQALGTTVEFLCSSKEDSYYSKYVFLKESIRNLLDSL